MTTYETDRTDYLKSSRHLAAVGGGQALENYDWLLYGLLASLFGPQFFQGEDVLTATLSALAVFGVAFAARPLGAVLFGPIADRIGRRAVMLWAVTAIAVLSIVFGLLPTYAQIGVAAPILLVVIRVLQGLSMGIEQPLNAAYNIDLAPPWKVGFYGGILQSWVQGGILVGSAVSFVTSLILGNEVMAEWGWRVPFIIGGLLGLVVLWLRRDLPETVKQEHKAARPSTKSVWKSLWEHRLAMFAILLVVGGAQVLNYGINSGLPSTAQAVFSQSPTVTFGVTTLSTFVVVVLCPLIGKAADKFRLSRTFIWSRIAAIPLVYVMVLYTVPSAATFAVVMVVAAVILSFTLGIFNLVCGSLVPNNSRVTGVGLGYALGVAIFGGTASYLFVWWSSLGLFWIFPTYVAVIIALSIWLYVAAKRSTGVYAGEYGSTVEQPAAQKSPEEAAEPER